VKVFRAADGRVRSGWVLASFGLTTGVTGVVAAIVTNGVSHPETLDDPRIAHTGLTLLVSAGVASLVCRYAFGEAVGLRDGRWWRHALVGFALGAGLLGVSCLVPMLVGVTSLSATSLPWAQAAGHALAQWAFLLPTAVSEELLVRGVPLRALSRGLGRFGAVALTSLFFGVMHLGNPNASLVAALNVALVGVLFGAITLRTGSLWCSIGLHSAWNFFEGTVFGQPVSGLTPRHALLDAHWPPARGFFSGGDFGPEAAGWTAVVLLLASVVVLLQLRQRGVP
jgi:membrane protease YdiL (CAAX protease family)